MPSKLFALIAVGALAGMLATGCSKSADSSSSTSTAAATATNQAATRTAGSAGDAAQGESIYSTNCAACHGARGVSSGVGPSLTGEKNRKSTAAVIAWVKNPAPPMPKLYPASLSEKDVADVAAYVESL